MPLYEDGRENIRGNLERIALGNRVDAIPVGFLTEQQLEEINKIQIALGFNCVGMPKYFSSESTSMKDGSEQTATQLTMFSIQIESALLEIQIPVIIQSNLTVIESTVQRYDRYGNQVCDRAGL